MIKVTCEVNNYDNPAKQNIRIYSHWNDSDKIEIEVGGEKFTVRGADLIQAVQNCMKTNQNQF